MRSVMRRTVLGSVFVLVAIALAALAVFGLPGAGTKDKAQPVGPPDTYVAQWDAIGAQALASSMLPPSDRVIIFAYVSIAVYDAVVAAKGGYEPFAVDRVV